MASASLTSDSAMQLGELYCNVGHADRVEQGDHATPRGGRSTRTVDEDRRRAGHRPSLNRGTQHYNCAPIARSKPRSTDWGLAGDEPEGHRPTVVRAPRVRWASTLSPR